MNSSEKAFLAGSHSTMEELLKAQVEIAAKAGLTDSKSQRIATEIVEKITERKKAEMKKVNNDVWEYTTPKALAPELYSYSFMMDGIKISDPSNVFMSRDVVTISNLFMIDGKESELYKVQNVPHGSLRKVW